MYPTSIADRLEHIPLRDSIISFSRLNANPVRYHHWHQCLEVLYVEEGYGVVIADNRHYTLRPGRLFIFPPFTLHKIMVEESTANAYRRTIIHVDQSAVFHAFDAFPHHQQKFSQLSARGSEAFVADLTDLHIWLNILFTHYSMLAEEYELDRENVATLLLSLFSMLPSQERDIQADEYKLSAQVMLWVEENYMKKISLDNMSLDLKKSKSYVSRRFHAETGEKLSEYITTYRLRKACEFLLRSKLSINEIGNMVGYSDTTYFITAFKKGIGESPLQYRKHHQK
ncbi:helix-turn-helix transcriptional regulator [Klebsiella variicola]|uniref:helix-turn-helix transcriptional regulator n=1 Tax=Klebsiella variicola TaxID=244366 RepID=UPI00184810AA|nr:AraC family transcriptional regulator [Klebsiella variicola]EFE1488236.1 AraC family transcriptional regulator [Escherichia coli]MBW5921610.1 AraC family transcriptional regulator [Klebsiella variicola]MCQ3870961.1 AraC family transcriptional regulator [Klebsiella variicola]HDK8413703.1 helix-turn-helix transcriptional regulator [Klebsiella pneumoniae]